MDELSRLHHHVHIWLRVVPYVKSSQCCYYKCITQPFWYLQDIRN